MPTTNFVMMIGNLTRDPELRSTPTGKKLAAFSVALQEKEKTHFIDVTAWEKTAEFVEKYFRKGGLVSIEGRLQLEQWEKDGQKRSKVSVVASRVNALRDPIGRAAREDEPEDTPPRDLGIPTPADEPADPPPPPKQAATDEDELPF